jgi:hypothetical protein
VRGEMPGSTGFPDPPSRAVEVFRGTLDPLELDAAERRATFASWLGPGVFHRFAGFFGQREIWESVLALPAPPIEFLGVLNELYIHRGVNDAVLVGKVFAHLELLLDKLDTAPSPGLARSLGLPATLGIVIDGSTFAQEAGASPPSTPSATHVLSTALEQLRVPTVWSLLPAARGSLSHRAREVPLDTLAAAAEALNLLGASGTVVRLLVLVLLLSEPSRVEQAHRRLLTRLLTSAAPRVPGDHVVHAWSLANR